MQKSKNGHIYVHDMDSFHIEPHNCLTKPYTEILESGFSKSVNYLESPLDLSKYTINSDGDLSLELFNAFGPKNSTVVYNVGDQGVEYVIKEIEVAKAVVLKDKVVDWLLDRKPTIFDKKRLIIATENKDV